MPWKFPKKRRSRLRQVVVRRTLCGRYRKECCTRTVGQLLTFAISLARSFKGPFDSETCQTVYGSGSAKPVIQARYSVRQI